MIKCFYFLPFLFLYLHDKKQHKVAVEYVRLCGFGNGGDRKSNSQNGNVKMTLDEIAKQLGTSKNNLTRALRIERNLTDSMKELLEDGKDNTQRSY